jgi:hypothetical protein
VAVLLLIVIEIDPAGEQELARLPKPKPMEIVISTPLFAWHGLF